MSVDKGRVRALLDRIAEEERQLHRLGALSDQELLGDPDRLASTKYRFIVAIEAAIDVCRHVVSAAGLRAPSDFADAFSVLAEGGFLPAASVDRLRGMARFRNLLVHGYARVDENRVVEILRSNVVDLSAFREAIARALTDGRMS